MLKKVLVVGPLPPPHTGNSLPILFLVNHMTSIGAEVKCFNIGKGTHVSGKFTTERLITWFAVYFHILLNKKSYDLIYLSIAESKLGNMRDLVFYLLLGNKRSTTFIHLLGGNSFKNIIKSNGVIGCLNRFYLKKIAKIIVESDFQKSFFYKAGFSDKIVVIENFAEDFYFSTLGKIDLKFKEVKKIKLVFLSNMLFGKGHIELLEGFMKVNNEIRNNFELHFAGNLVHDPYGNFLKIINENDNIQFHGFINGKQKKDLLESSHVFCLPTYYPYEGLPFSIIEAYASGCIGLLSYHSGIPCIFKDRKNGFLVEKENAISIKDNLEAIYNYVNIDVNYLKIMAINNYNQACSRNKSEIFLNKFTRLINNGR